MSAGAWRRANPLPQLVPRRVRRAFERLQAALWGDPRELVVWGGPVNERPVPPRVAKTQLLSRVVSGERFGPSGGGWHQRWFRIDLPSDAAGHLHWRCDGEATVYVDDRPWAGLDFAHRHCALPQAARALWIDCATYATGIQDAPCPRIGPHGLVFDGAHLAVRDPAAWRAIGELDPLLQLLRLLLKDGGHAIDDGRYGHQAALERASPLLRKLLRALDDACDVLDGEGVGAFAGALEEVRRRFPSEPWQPAVSVCPQTHIDLVWLWPEEEAERKAVHSLATALRLMEAYPAMTFTCSQPALYRALERRAPTLFAEIRTRIAEGRWEATGGFDVEVDTNLPCGEALARSLILGQRALASLRGRPNTVCWLPDVFGYSACLPQVLALAGVRYFFTTKLRWSAITRFPYQSFIWRSPDGSEVLAQISTIGYTGTCDLEPLVTVAREYGQADVSPEILVAQGLGDGGGGPTEGMCERVARLEDLAGVPPVRFRKAEDFFTRIEQVRPRLPIYQGELYLEYHRGTYTSQSDIKRLYRRAETALQAHEAVRVATGNGPIDERLWQRLAFAQFHDALPGSSIALVYEQLRPELKNIAEGALSSAVAEVPTGRDGVLAFNPLPVSRLVLVDGVPVRLPALGGERVGAPPPDLPPVQPATTTVLDNGLLRVQFEGGAPVGLTIAGEAIALDGPIGLTLAPDHPSQFDAWDIDHHTCRAAVPLVCPRLGVLEQGPFRAVLRGELPVGARSHAVVDYILEAGSPWLRIEIDVDWREEHVLLRLRAPTAYRGPCARFGAPFGSVLRPQHPGGPQEEAMWEVPGSRWATVGDDDGRGLAIITEAKYGFSCRDGELAVSLLRAPADPDPTADRGRHQIRLAVGASRDAALAAETLFSPVLRVPNGHLPAPPVRVSDLGTLLPSWVQPLGDGFVLRLHETAGARGVARLHLRDEPRRVALVDLLGEPLASIERDLPYRPYQILSVRVWR